MIYCSYTGLNLNYSDSVYYNSNDDKYFIDLESLYEYYGIVKVNSMYNEVFCTKECECCGCILDSDIEYEMEFLYDSKNKVVYCSEECYLEDNGIKELYL